MSRDLVWVTGANGLIGSYLMRTAPQCVPNLDVRPITRERVDLLDFTNVRRLWKEDDPALVIHCAALSRSLACQKDPALAQRVNVELAATLAELASQRPMIFFSSDLVYDGLQGNYREEDAVSPLTVYGQNKAEAERIVLRNPKHAVVRTSLNAGISRAGDRSFNEETRLAWESGKTLNLFTDEFRCPISALVTAQAVWTLVKVEARGLFHLAGAERLSRWQIGELLAKRWPHLEARMNRSSLRDFLGPPRSADTSLNCEKVQKVLSFSLPRFGQWLEENPNEPI